MDSNCNNKNIRKPQIQSSAWLEWVYWKETKKDNIINGILLSSLETIVQQPSSNTSTYYF
jgi:hypothetical protein